MFYGMDKIKWDTLYYSKLEIIRLKWDELNPKTSNNMTRSERIEKKLFMLYYDCIILYKGLSLKDLTSCLKFNVTDKMDADKFDYFLKEKFMPWIYYQNDLCKLDVSNPLYFLYNLPDTLKEYKTADEIVKIWNSYSLDKITDVNNFNSEYNEKRFIPFFKLKKKRIQTKVNKTKLLDDLVNETRILHNMIKDLKENNLSELEWNNVTYTKDDLTGQNKVNIISEIRAKIENLDIQKMKVNKKVKDKKQIIDSVYLYSLEIPVMKNEYGDMFFTLHTISNTPDYNFYNDDSDNNNSIKETTDYFETGL